MISNCDYCKNPFKGERCTKRYCSDNCRQMAYLSRKGYVVNGNLNNVKDTHGVNSVKPNVKDIFYANDIKYTNDVKDIKDSINPSQTQVEPPLDGFLTARLIRRIELLEKTIEEQNHLLLTMWTNIKAELESNRLRTIHEIGRQLEKHNPFRQGFNGLDYCKPCTVKDFTLKPFVKDNTLTTSENNPLPETSAMVDLNTEQEIAFTEHSDKNIDNNKENWGLYNNTQNKSIVSSIDDTDTVKLNEAQQRIEELEQKLFESNLLLSEKGNEEQEKELEEHEEQITENNEEENKVGDSRAEDSNQETPELETEPEPESYQWINPRLHIQIQRQIDKGDGGYSFRHALSYWPVEEAKSVLWVNVRLRCLLDNLVNLSLRSHTNYETVSSLANAFIDLSNSEAYKNLPADYPYTNLIAELTEMLRSVALECYSQKKAIEKIPIWMSVKRKSSIIAACTELANSTEKVKFSQLSFKAVTLQPAFIKRAKNITERGDEDRVEKHKKWQTTLKKELKERERNQKAS